jgi:hypothetical protein
VEVVFVEGCGDVVGVGGRLLMVGDDSCDGR